MEEAPAEHAPPEEVVDADDSAEKEERTDAPPQAQAPAPEVNEVVEAQGPAAPAQQDVVPATEPPPAAAASPKKGARKTAPGSPLSARPQTSCSSLPPTPTAPGPYLANGVRGGRFGTGMPKSDVDWIIYRAKQVPGPGEYGAPDTRKFSGGRFSTCKPKSDVEWEMLRASKIPAPGQYDIKDHIPNGGKFSSANPKSDLDWQMIRAAQVPGPGEYPVTKHGHVSGGRLSTSAIVTDVDISMRRAKKLPGPGAYDVSSSGIKKSGGRFSTAKPKSDVEWIMHRAKQIPGPGEYHRALPAPSGGKFGASSPKTNLEEIMHRAAKLPGPGMYDSDIYSISRRTGAVPPYPSSAPPSKPATAQSEHSGIPPEARRKPKPKKQDQEEAPAGPRPHTSLGFSSDGASGEVHRGRMPELEPLSEKQAKHKTPWYKRGMSRDGSLRSLSPAKWNIPESAQRAYGVWIDEVPRKKKPKGRSKTRSDDKTAPVVIKVRVNSMNSQGVDGKYDIEVFDHELPVVDPSEATEQGTATIGKEGASGADDWTATAAKRDHLSANAQKLFDLAMQSVEFREMMKLYTGMEDPTSIIEKYAEMWAKKPLAATAASKKQLNTPTSAARRPGTSMH